MKRFNCTIFLIFAGIVLSPLASAGIISYSDLASWEAAVGGAGSYTTDTFSSGNLNRADFDITKPNGVVSGYTTNVSGGVLFDRVSSTSNTLLTFSSYIDSFAADFALSVAGAGTGLRFFADGTLVGSIGGGLDVFRGFTSSIAFNQVEFDSSGSIETYSLDNVRYAQVPEPGTLLLLGAGLLGLGLRRRQR